MTSDSSKGLIDLEFDRLACVTIQGGGVYGLSLLGQLQALVERAFVPVALAGTSAGAIVATLYWARLSPELIRDLIIDQATPPNQLTDLIGDLKDHKGRRPKQFELGEFRAFQENISRCTSELGDLVKEEGVGQIQRFLLSASLYLKLASPLGKIGKLLWRKRGFFSGDALEAFIDSALCLSPYVQQNLDLLPINVRQATNSGQAPSPLTFAHFRIIREHGVFVDEGEESSPYLPPLFLTATNLTTQSLELINSIDARYQNLSVAKAVRASAGFPIFFRPVTVELEENEFCLIDGGLIANYPTFVFGPRFRQWLGENDPLSVDVVGRTWVHVGLTLTTRNIGVGPAGHAEDTSYLSNSMSQLLIHQARRQLEDRLAQGMLHSIPIAISPDDTGGPGSVLGVENLGPVHVKAMYNNGLKAATLQLDRFGFAYPPAAQIEPILEELILTVGSLFEGLLGAEGLGLRSSVFVPSAGELLMRYRARMDPSRDSDWNLKLNFGQGLTGYCFGMRVPLVANLERIREKFDQATIDDVLKMNPKRQSQIRDDRTFLLSVPIFDPDGLSILSLPLGESVKFEPTNALLPKAEYYSQVGGHTLDGPTFGVLNLDAGWDYARIQLDPSPDACAIDPRVRTVVMVMQMTSVRIGRVFAKSFPKVKSESK